jgi:SAM-dependent methyltransferase
VLTIDFRRLRLRPGDRVLDAGCGAGRHAFEAYRRGARVVALDTDAVELKRATDVLAAMYEAGETAPGGAASPLQASALDLPFPDGAFDHVVVAEVLEHIDDDRGAIRELARVLRPGGTLAVTVPRFFPELVCWALSDEYHAPAVPGGHIRIYRESVLRQRVQWTGLRVTAVHHAHGLHTPYWWLRCAIGPHDDGHPLVRAYHQVLVWEMTGRWLPLRLAERALQPVLGKSLVLYARKEAM